MCGQNATCRYQKHESDHPLSAPTFYVTWLGVALGVTVSDVTLFGVRATPIRERPLAGGSSEFLHPDGIIA
ncbi:MAG TPA: hypothetical protein VN841_09250 [Bryobacteraceae bacterium]|nr:hypothetical protein [Bryobacteraceae bacterium]